MKTASLAALDRVHIVTSVRLPYDLWHAAQLEKHRRQLEGESNASVSAIMCEGLAEKLNIEK